MRIVIPFIVGIILSSSFSVFGGYEIDSYLVIVSLVLITIIILQKINQYFAASYLICLFFVGLGTVYTAQFNLLQQPKGNYEKELFWIGEVKSNLKKSETLSSCIIEVKQIKQESKWQKAILKVKFQSKDGEYNFKVGDLVSGKSKFYRFKEPLNPQQFNYAEYMENKGVYYYSFEEDFQLHATLNSINSVAASIRNGFIESYQKMGIEGDEKAILEALCLGDKSELNEQLKSSYAAAGAMHVLAVSGLHVGIIFLLLNQLTRRFPTTIFFRWLKVILLLSGIWVFAILTGLSPSVQRASWMFSFIVLSKGLNRHSNVLNSIAGSALILLLINPKIILDVGFQLSYAAVIGIVLIHPVLSKWLVSKYAILEKVWSLLVVSLSATMTTLPFTIFYFHQFPNWFL